MLIRAKNRWQAFGMHIAISAILFVVIAAIIYFWWYPGFLFRFDGGLEGMKLLAGVDFVIGPTLTLVVYKVGKKTLRFDLACIAVLQLACIGGGMWTVGKTRPVAVIYAAGSYATVNKIAYEAKGYQPEKIASLQGHWPLWLAVKMPEGAEGGIGSVWALMGEDIHTNVENYVPYADILGSLPKVGMNASDIKNAKGDLKTFQVNYPDSRFFPVTTSMYAGYLAVDIKTGQVLSFFQQI